MKKNDFIPLTPAKFLAMIKNRLLVRCITWEVGELGVAHTNIVIYSDVEVEPKETFLRIFYHESCMPGDFQRRMDLCINEVKKREVQKLLDDWAQNLHYWTISREIIACEGEGADMKFLDQPISLRMMLHFARLEAKLHSGTETGEWGLDVDRALNRLSALIEQQIKNWERVLVI